MLKNLRVFGIDPGTATTGYGVIDTDSSGTLVYVSSGTIQTSKQEKMPERLKAIRADILSLLKKYQPQVVSIESIFFFKNAKTLIPVSQARGVILEAAATAGVEVFEYTPMQVKLSLTGFGRADKKLVQTIVATVLGHEHIIKPDDASDALALAICHTRAILSNKP